MKKFLFKSYPFSIYNLLIIIFSIVAGIGLNCNLFHSDYFIPINERGYVNPNAIVSVKELKDMNDIIIINTSQGKYSFIPGATWFDLNQIFRKINDKDIYIQTKEKLEELMGNMGIPDNKTIIIYDNRSVVRAARLWWTLKVYGHPDVKLLDGGFDAWRASGYDSVNISNNLPKATYVAKEFDKNLCVDLSHVKDKIGKERVIFLDTRSIKEYNDGHIPGAIHIEWTNNINKNKTFKTAKELREIYESKGITPDKEIIIYCGSGTRATVTLFTLRELLGYPKATNYNGSWIEYSTTDLPKEKEKSK